MIFLYTDDRDIFKEKAERIYQIIDEADGFSAEISEKLGQSFSIDKQHQISCSIGIAAGDHICTENDMTEMIKRRMTCYIRSKQRQKEPIVYENRFT